MNFGKESTKATRPGSAFVGWLGTRALACVDALERVSRVMPLQWWQQAILLHRRNGMTYTDISAKLGIAVGRH